MIKLWENNQIIWMLLILIIVVGGVHSSVPDLRGLIIFIVLTVMLMLSLYLTNRYYLAGEVTLKHKLIKICISFILFTLYYLLVRELVEFSLNYGFFVLFFIALAIFSVWEHLELTYVEKVVLILTLVVIILVRVYPEDEPVTSAQLYLSELREVQKFEEFQEKLTEEAKESFTREDFLEIKSYLQERPLRTNQPAIIEFEGGDLILVETGYNINDDKLAGEKKLRIKNIELLPEKIASYFRYYPLEIKREADKPEKIEDNDEKIIECKGAFVSHGTWQQKRDWHDQLMNVFGKKETWDNIWRELDIQLAEGPVVGAGSNQDGYLEITFEEEWKVDEEQLDKIYKAFHNKASEHGIKDLPMVFKQRRVD